MPQQLYKKTDNKMIFGVCSGLSDITGIDVTIVRLLTLFGAIFTGSLIFWIYILLAIILPKKS